MNLNISQLNESRKHFVFRPQQEVPRSKARFKPTLPKKLEMEQSVANVSVPGHYLQSVIYFTLICDAKTTTTTRDNEVLRSKSTNHGQFRSRINSQCKAYPT